MILDGGDPKNIQQAVDQLRRGVPVAFPTETVYGLGANVFDETGVRAVFELKGRPLNDPLIAHVAATQWLDEFLVDWSLIADRELGEAVAQLIDAYWPGPLTLVLPKKKQVSGLVTAGLSHIAVRMPQHPTALALLRAFGGPLVAPSANKFQSLSPTTARHVAQAFEHTLVLDGGPCAVGVESTVVAFGPKSLLVILRPGGISLEDLSRHWRGPVVQKTPEVQDRPEGVQGPQAAPGLLAFHYAPTKPLQCVSLEILLERLEKMAAKDLSDQLNLSTTVFLVFSLKEKAMIEKAGGVHVWTLSDSGQLDEAAHSLYECLHRADRSAFDRIIAVELPQQNLGVAINDRLRKGAHGFENF